MGSQCFLVGRKGDGKSAIAVKIRLNAQANGDPIAFFTPADFKHVELRALLKDLYIDTQNIEWQYLYGIVWEGIIIGQIIRCIQDSAYKKHFYKLSKELQLECDKFSTQCGFYMDTLGDSLINILVEHLTKHNSELSSGTKLVQLRKLLCPYDTGILLKLFREDVNAKRFPKLYICIDGLDDHWDTSPASLYFLAQAINSVKLLRGKLGTQVQFIICLRDNIFRSLLDTKSIEHVKIDPLISYLSWTPEELFQLVAMRFFHNTNPDYSASCLEGMLPKEINGVKTRKYISNMVFNRPRDYINFFKKIQGQSFNNSGISVEHIVKALDGYSQDKLADLENEYNYTYPGISIIISSLADLPDVFNKIELFNIINEILANDSYRLKAPKLFEYYGEHKRLSMILLSIGAIGCYDRNSKSMTFIAGYDESRMSAILTNSSDFVLHPIYRKSFLGDSDDTENNNPLNEPHDYSEASRENIETIDELDKEKHAKLLGEYRILNSGPEDAHKFNTWVDKALLSCFHPDIAEPNSQVKTHDERKRFETIFRILTAEYPWNEMHSEGKKYLYVECKNYANLDTDDIEKVKRDLESLDYKTAFVVHRGDKIEPSKKHLDLIRSVYTRSFRKHIIILLTDNFLESCLETQSKDTRMRKLAGIWRDYNEKYLSL